MEKARFDKVFLLLIPLGVIALMVICNFGLDFYYQARLDKDTKEVLNYVLTKDCSTVEECRSIAIEQFEIKKYTDNEALTAVVVSDEYLLLVRYNYITDLRVFLNIFHIQIFNDKGYIDDAKIDSSLAKHSGMQSSKWMVTLNEYNEPIIEKFKGDENDFILTNETTTTTTAVAVTNDNENNEE